MMLATNSGKRAPAVRRDQAVVLVFAHKARPYERELESFA